MRAPAPWAIAPLVSVVALCLSGSGAQAQLPQLPQFRAGVTLVPVEVRVVDRDGNPVLGLTQADFAIREDGRPQDIAHFQFVTVDSTSETARTFLIMLGRGRLNEPTKAVQALIDFVRTTVRPADRVGVFAYNRIINFTTNHEVVAKFLEYYRDRHDSTDGGLERDDANRAVRPPPMTPETMAAIDAHFTFDADVRALAKDLAGGTGNALARFFDWHYLKTTLNYLMTVPGEKHVVVLGERIFPAPQQSDDPLENYFFKLATSARATLWFIHTGGMPAPTVAGGGLSAPRTLAIQAQRDLANQTGGMSAFFQYAAKSLDALDRATRSYYVFGYYPTKDVLPEQYRRVEVSVTKPGLTLLYRHGFQARPMPVEESQDYRPFVTQARTEEALAKLLLPSTDRGLMSANPRGVFWDLRLSAKAGKRTADGETLKVAVAFDAWLAKFTKEGSAYVMDVDLTLVADDDKRNVIGEHRQRLHISLTEAEFKRAKRQWPTFDITFDVKGRAAFVRGVLFQFETDRAASRQATVQR